MIFNIRDSGLILMITLQIYLKNTETSIKGPKKAEGISKRKLSLEEITNYNSRIYALYMNVAIARLTPLFI
jgi:hypothetical protein